MSSALKHPGRLEPYPHNTESTPATARGAACENRERRAVFAGVSQLKCKRSQAEAFKVNPETKKKETDVVHFLHRSREHAG